MADATCPICGKRYSIPDGRGREMVITKFLAHKDNCELPKEDEFVRVGGRVGIVIEIDDHRGTLPLFAVQMPSGRTNTFPAAQVSRMPDQGEGRRIFYD